MCIVCACILSLKAFWPNQRIIGGTHVYDYLSISPDHLLFCVVGVYVGVAQGLQKKEADGMIFSICLSVSPSLRLSVSLSLCLSVPLSLCLSVSLSLCVSGAHGQAVEGLPSAIQVRTWPVKLHLFLWLWRIRRQKPGLLWHPQGCPGWSWTRMAHGSKWVLWTGIAQHAFWFPSSLSAHNGGTVLLQPQTASFARICAEGGSCKKIDIQSPTLHCGPCKHSQTNSFMQLHHNHYNPESLIDVFFP